MTRPTGFGAQCEHGSLARSCERCDDAETIADLRDQNERMRRLLDYVQQTAPGVLVAAHVNAGKP